MIVLSRGGLLYDFWATFTTLYQLVGGVIKGGKLLHPRQAEDTTTTTMKRTVRMGRRKLLSKSICFLFVHVNFVVCKFRGWEIIFSTSNAALIINVQRCSGDGEVLTRRTMRWYAFRLTLSGFDVFVRKRRTKNAIKIGFYVFRSIFSSHPQKKIAKNLMLFCAHYWSLCGWKKVHWEM